MELNTGLAKSVFAAFLSVFSLAACGPLNSNHNSQIDSTLNEKSAIIAGKIVSTQEPISQHIVGIFSYKKGDSENGAICTGSLLPGNIVLTAAHCVDEFMTIIFAQDFNSAQANQVLRVDKVSIAASWKTQRDAAKDHGDIAVLHFVGTVPAGFEPAEFLTDATALQKGTIVTLAGFGVNHVAETPIDVSTYPNLIESVQSGKVICDDPQNLKNCFQVDMTGSGTLRETQVQISDSKFSQTEILLNQTNGTGACHGDSGGPAYVIINGKYYLWGITSRAENDPKNDCSQYSVYTNALAYKTWIRDAISSMIASPGPRKYLLPTLKSK